MVEDLPDLGELEREVLNLVWSHGALTADGARKHLAKKLKESTVRTVLTRLEDKGFLTHGVEGRTFVYSPAQSRGRVAARAVKRAIDWFCNGSVEEVLVGMVDSKMLDQKQLEALTKKIEAAKKRKA